MKMMMMPSSIVDSRSCPTAVATSIVSMKKYEKVVASKPKRATKKYFPVSINAENQQSIANCYQSVIASNSSFSVYFPRKSLSKPFVTKNIRSSRSVSHSRIPS
jgi:hypothetical protein